ncbi:hypothetical protein EMIT0158MI4_20208 [Burkholderia ambifaria]
MYFFLFQLITDSSYESTMFQKITESYM